MRSLNNDGFGRCLETCQAPLVLDVLLCSLQLWAHKPWVTEETGPSVGGVSAYSGVLCPCPCPVMQPALTTKRKVMGVSSSWNLIQDDAVPHLLGMIGLEMRIYHDQW